MTKPYTDSTGRKWIAAEEIEKLIEEWKEWAAPTTVRLRTERAVIHELETLLGEE